MLILFKQRYSIYVLLYISFILSYIFGENSSGGSERDYFAMQIYQDQISSDIKNGIIFFIEKGQGHSPFFYIIKSILESFLSKTISNIIFLSLGFLIPIVFYTILKKKFFGFNKNFLFAISLILYFSPYLRSSAAWATNDNLAVLFFVLSLSKFLSFKKNNNDYLKNIFLSFFYLVIAAYIRQYYVIVILLYSLLLYGHLSLKNFVYLTIFTSLLMAPGILYTYNYLQINFDYAAKGFAKPNLILNLLVFSTMYLFYLLPFFLNFENLNKVRHFYNNNKILFLIISIIYIYVIYYYNFQFAQFGGGIFYKISMLINSKYIFIFCSYIGFLFLLSTINLNVKNLSILLVLFFMFPFAIIYQKYYDPLIIIFFFGILQSDMFLNNIGQKKINLSFVYVYFFIFLIGTNLYYNHVF